jgi:hypothetical protein
MEAEVDGLPWINAPGASLERLSSLAVESGPKAGQKSDPLKPNVCFASWLEEEVGGLRRINLPGVALERQGASAIESGP